MGRLDRCSGSLLLSWCLVLITSLALADSASPTTDAVPVTIAAQRSLNVATTPAPKRNPEITESADTTNTVSSANLSAKAPPTAEPVATFKLGLENISAELSAKIKPLRLALITNQTGVTQANQRNIDYLLSQGYQIVRIYVPEHGLTGKILAEKTVPDTVDPTTKIPVVSLYGGDSAFKKPAKSALEQIDAFVFDLQDSGMRHYTYISILLRMMQVAAEFQKLFVVLDRPNPLGSVMEGPLVDPGLESFISIAAIPLRHALTVGELAQYFNARVLKGVSSTSLAVAPAPKLAESTIVNGVKVAPVTSTAAGSVLPAAVALNPSAATNDVTLATTPRNSAVNLVVVPMANYTRERGLAGQLLQPLSPNLAYLQSLYGYSFLGLLGELNPVDVAIKTPAAFQAIGLPIRQAPRAGLWTELQALLAKHQISSTPYRYTNAAGDWPFQGLKLQITDINQVAAFPALLDCVQFFRDKLQLSFKYGPSFDKAVGTKKFKQWVTGALALADWQTQMQQDLQNFATVVTPYLLYTPAPKITAN
ncbi:MAG TPA: DUF1343 domain-containing protein [Candidatus Babeliales bacterium]|nr:DUF1343 domain-containing protein [Candidatus Babeliales bacterium]